MSSQLYEQFERYPKAITCVKSLTKIFPNEPYGPRNTMIATDWHRCLMSVGRMLP